MSNSIFDDDDGFTLSGGFDGEETKKTPVKPASKTPEANTPRPATARPQQKRQEAHVRQETSSRPQPGGSGLPVKPSVSKPPVPNTGRTAPPPLPTQRRQSASSSLPTSPQPVRREPTPIVRNEEPEVFLPPAPVPTHVEPEDISYSHEVEEELHDETYHPPVDYEAEARAAEERIRKEERERELQRERERERINREREQEEAEEREREERRRVERESRRQEERKATEAARYGGDDDTDNDNEDAAPPTKTRGLRSKAKGNAKTKNAKRGSQKKEKEPGKYSGGRVRVLVFRIVIFTLLFIFVAAGAKATFSGYTGPTKDQVIDAAKEGIGVTDFPRGDGDGFVIGFSKIYLSVPEGGIAERNEALLSYMPQTVLAEQTYSQTPSEDVKTQNVTSGPFVSGVNYVDDTNAVYTVTAQVNNSRWLYIDVPVAFNPANHSFVISGSPAYVPAPDLAEVKGQPKEWTDSDADVAEEFQPSLELFFDAWASSDAVKFKAYITQDANPIAKTGLDGIAQFKSITALSVQPEGADPETGVVVEPTIRKARVTVEWESTIVPGTTYGQTYDLVIEKVADMWRIKELQGGVPSETDSAPGQEETTIETQQ